MQEQADEFNTLINAEFEALKNEINRQVPVTLPDFNDQVAAHYKNVNDIIYFAGRDRVKVNITNLNAQLQNLIVFIQSIHVAAPEIETFRKNSIELITALKQRFLHHDPEALAAAEALARAAPPVVDVVPPAAPVAPPAPAPPVVVADPAVDRLPNDEFHKAIKASIATFNNDNPGAKAKIEPLEVLPNHDIHCKIKYSDVTNIKPIIIKRQKGEHLSLTSETPTIETRKEQARLLKDLPPKGPKTLKLAADTPAGFKELWKAMREAEHHIIGMSHEQQELLSADPALAHLIERAGPSLG